MLIYAYGFILPFSFEIRRKGFDNKVYVHSFQLKHSSFLSRPIIAL